MFRLICCVLRLISPLINGIYQQIKGIACFTNGTDALGEGTQSSMDNTTSDAHPPFTLLWCPTILLISTVKMTLQTPPQTPKPYFSGFPELPIGIRFVFVVPSQ